MTAKRKSASLKQVCTQETGLKISYAYNLSKAFFQRLTPAITLLLNIMPWVILAILLWMEELR